MGKPLVHWEFWSQDPKRIGDFYTRVFDWNIRHMPEMAYALVETGGQGGIMTPQKVPWPGNMAFYIDVEDLATYRDKIKNAGGKVLVEEQTMPGVGAFALFEDPNRRVLGMWQQFPKQG